MFVIGNGGSGKGLNQRRLKSQLSRNSGVNFRRSIRRFLYRAAFSLELQTIASRMLFNPDQ